MTLFFQKKIDKSWENPRTAFSKNNPRKILFKSYTENYKNLLEKPRRPSMEIKQEHTCATEIFKSLNIEFMKYIFSQSLHTSHREFNLQVPYQNTSKSSECTSLTHYLAQLEKCTYSEFLWSAFPALGLNMEMPVRMQENMVQKNSEYRHFSRSVGSQSSKFIRKF